MHSLVTAALGFLSAVFFFLLVNRHIVFGSIEGRWIYPYFKRVHPQAIIVAALLALVVAVAAKISLPLVARRELWVLAAWLAIGTAFPFIVRIYAPYSMTRIMLSNQANSYYEAMKVFEPGTLLTDFENIAPRLPYHARHNMPGKVLLYHLMGFMAKSPGGIAVLIVLVANLSSLIIYYITRLLFDDRAAAFLAFALNLFLPAKLAFLPLLNTVSPIFLLMALLFLVLFASSRSDLSLILFGLSIYLMLFFEPSPLYAAGMFPAVLIHGHVKRPLNTRDIGRVPILSIASFMTVYVIIYLLFRFDLIRALMMVFGDVQKFNPLSKRPYGVWLAANLKEFIFACGFMPGVIYILSLGKTVYHLARKCRGGQRIGVSPGSVHEFGADLYTLVLMLTLIFINLTGYYRGEVTRHWIFLAMLVQIPVAVSWIVNRREFWAAFLIGLSALQGAIMMTTVGFVIP